MFDYGLYVAEVAMLFSALILPELYDKIKKEKGESYLDST